MSKAFLSVSLYIHTEKLATTSSCFSFVSLQQYQNMRAFNLKQQSGHHFLHRSDFPVRTFLPWVDWLILPWVCLAYGNCLFLPRHSCIYKLNPTETIEIPGLSVENLPWKKITLTPPLFGAGGGRESAQSMQSLSSYCPRAAKCENTCQTAAMWSPKWDLWHCVVVTGFIEVVKVCPHHCQGVSFSHWNAFNIFRTTNSVKTPRPPFLLLPPLFTFCLWASPCDRLPTAPMKWLESAWCQCERAGRQAGRGRLPIVKPATTWLRQTLLIKAQQWEEPCVCGCQKRREKPLSTNSSYTSAKPLRVTLSKLS